MSSNTSNITILNHAVRGWSSNAMPAPDDYLSKETITFVMFSENNETYTIELLPSDLETFRRGGEVTDDLLKQWVVEAKVAGQTCIKHE